MSSNNDIQQHLYQIPNVFAKKNDADDITDINHGMIWTGIPAKGRSFSTVTVEEKYSFQSATL